MGRSLRRNNHKNPSLRFSDNPCQIRCWVSASSSSDAQEHATSSDFSKREAIYKTIITSKLLIDSVTPKQAPYKPRQPYRTGYSPHNLLLVAKPSDNHVERTATDCCNTSTTAFSRRHEGAKIKRCVQAVNGLPKAVGQRLSTRICGTRWWTLLRSRCAQYLPN
jgi:hypothetical protein